MLKRGMGHRSTSCTQRRSTHVSASCIRHQCHPSNSIFAFRTHGPGEILHQTFLKCSGRRKRPHPLDEFRVLSERHPKPIARSVPNSHCARSHNSSFGEISKIEWGMSDSPLRDECTSHCYTRLKGVSCDILLSLSACEWEQQPWASGRYSAHNTTYNPMTKHGMGR